LEAIDPESFDSTDCSFFLFTFGLMKLNINKADFSRVQNEGW